jgi:RNA polymerase sigma-70 factor, ECF subfamily
MLMERHERRVYHLALRMVGDAEDAADAAQDAWLTAFRKLGSFRGDAAFSTWLHRVAVNASFDVLRRRQRGPVLRPVAEGEDHPSLPDPGAADHADEVAGTTDIERALALVPEEFRAPLVLHDVLDLPYQEVASVLGVPIGTVKSRLHRGRMQLARTLRGLIGPDESPAEVQARIERAGEHDAEGDASNQGPV